MSASFSAYVLNKGCVIIIISAGADECRSWLGIAAGFITGFSALSVVKAINVLSESVADFEYYIFS